MQHFIVTPPPALVISCALVNSLRCPASPGSTTTHPGVGSDTGTFVGVAVGDPCASAGRGNSRSSNRRAITFQDFIYRILTLDCRVAVGVAVAVAEIVGVAVAVGVAVGHGAVQVGVTVGVAEMVGVAVAVAVGVGDGVGGVKSIVAERAVQQSAAPIVQPAVFATADVLN